MVTCHFGVALPTRIYNSAPPVRLFLRHSLCRSQSVSYKGVHSRHGCACYLLPSASSPLLVASCFTADC